jgi:hypothetical protein
MVAVTSVCPPSQPDGSGSVALALFNIQSGRNGGIEVALRAMDQLGVDIGFLLETKLMGGIYTWHLSGHNVLALNATLSSSGGIALFWRGNISYEVVETQIWGPNVISMHLMMGSTQLFCCGVLHPTLQPGDIGVY